MKSKLVDEALQGRGHAGGSRPSGDVSGSSQSIHAVFSSLK